MLRLGEEKKSLEGENYKKRQRCVTSEVSQNEHLILHTHVEGGRNRSLRGFVNSEGKKGRGSAQE